MINLILFGPPGSGKGTQAAHLVDKYNLIHISTGDMFRANIKAGTALGLEAQSYMDKGQLVPDAVTIGMFGEKLDAHPDAGGFIFDGFPRTIPQAEALDQLLAERDWSVSGLIALTVDDEELVARLLNRGKDSGRADDSNEVVIRQRIAVYKRDTTPVFDFYALQSKSHKVKGEGSIDDIGQRLYSLIDTF
jgi:adenylate kinase